MAAARGSGGGNEEDVDALALRLATDEENATFAVRKRLFIAIGVLNIAMNFDSGVLPATCVRPVPPPAARNCGLSLRRLLVPLSPPTGMLRKCSPVRRTAGHRLGHVQEQFDFSYTELGILGSLVYSKSPFGSLSLALAPLAPPVLSVRRRI
jgi:hypothetical protein